MVYVTVTVLPMKIGLMKRIRSDPADTAVAFAFSIMSVDVVEAKPMESTPCAMRFLYGVRFMISSLTWFGLKSPVMPANRYTSDSPTVLLDETLSPISSPIASVTGSLFRAFTTSLLSQLMVLDITLMHLRSAFTPSYEPLPAFSTGGWFPRRNRAHPRSLPYARLA